MFRRPIAKGEFSKAMLFLRALCRLSIWNKWSLKRPGAKVDSLVLRLKDAADAPADDAGQIKTARQGRQAAPFARKRLMSSVSALPRCLAPGGGRDLVYREVGTGEFVFRVKAKAHGCLDCTVNNDSADERHQNPGNCPNDL